MEIFKAMEYALKNGKGLAEKTVKDDKHSTPKHEAEAAGKFIPDRQPANHIEHSKDGVHTE